MPTSSSPGSRSKRTDPVLLPPTRAIAAAIYLRNPAEAERANLLQTHLGAMSERLASASERLGAEEARRAELPAVAPATATGAAA